MYVLKRTDQGCGYVAMPGSEKSYTTSLEKARKFKSRAAAEANRCGNEVVIPLASLTGESRHG